MSKRKYYYALVNKKGNLVTESCYLPIFQLKKVAKKRATDLNCGIKKIYVGELEYLISSSLYLNKTLKPCQDK